MIGGGGSDYALITSQLNLCCTQRQLKGSFTSNEETMGMHIIDMAKKVVQDNLNDEKLASELVKDPICVKAHQLAIAPGSADTLVGLDDVGLEHEIPKVPSWYACPETTGVEEWRPKERNIGLSMDAGWRKRSSGRRYDSQMGRFFAFGRRTILSPTNRCQCVVETANTTSYTIQGCACIATPVLQRVWNRMTLWSASNPFFSKGDAFVGTIVTDDDSTMRSRLKQNGTEKVEAGVAVLEDLPKSIQLRKSSDHGALDLDVPKPVCKADANHHVRAYTYGNALHKLVDMRNADSSGVTGVDRDRLKQKNCYARAKNVCG
jgi:hypothetical protein